MKAKRTLKLTLNKETIRSLTESELSAVAAGAGTLTSTPVSRITCQSSCCDTMTTVTVTIGVTCVGQYNN